MQALVYNRRAFIIDGQEKHRLMDQAKTTSPIRNFPAIADVYTVPIRVFEDERGRFMETFRKTWFPWIDWERVQHNRSDSKAGVVRGLHYHHQQVDYWYVTKGVVRAALVDLRPNSDTYRVTATLEIGEGHNEGLFIPVGVAHGFAALSDCTLMYVVNNYYDGGKDEFGIAWDDPDLRIDWGVESPVVSPRDAQNPRLRDIPRENLPRG